jgi:hypothetical protein
VINIQEIVLGGLGALGYLVGAKFVPDLPILGKFSDLVVGLVISVVGYFLHDYLLAFGVGMVIEGVVRAFLG